MDPSIGDAIARGNPVVFFDITIGGMPAGRIKIELFADIRPRNAEIFRQVRTGIKITTLEFTHYYIFNAFIR